jgi:predicted nucleotidyltransferase
MIRFKRLPEDMNQRIKALIKTLADDPNITFAYLFGGLLRDRKNPLSDVDIAVSIKNVKDLDYLNLLGKVTTALGTDEVDLVILNTAPISLTGRVLQGRRVLVDKNPFMRHRYESITLRKYFDFRIKEREILGRRYGLG